MISVVLLAGGTLVVLAALYLLVLAVAALWAPSSSPVAAVGLRLVVLVPAHNEAELIERCLRSLQHQSYPSSLYELAVVADNCDDDTAGIADSCGASVMVRDCPEARGKGRALRWGMDAVLSRPSPPDGVVVVDADSVAGPYLIAGLAAQLSRGADAVQAEYLALDGGQSPRALLSAAAFVLFHRVRFGGRARLGLPCSMVGNGMAFSRRVLLAVPWNAFSGVEDLEYSLTLRRAGIRPVYAPGAGVRGPVAARGRAARTQRLRWEGGRLDVVRRQVPGLVKAALGGRDWSLVDAALDLATPPLGLLTAAAVSGTAISLVLSAVGAVPVWAAGTWLAALAAIPCYVVVGLRAGRAPASTFRALLFAPGLLCSQMLNRLRLLGGLRASVWERTERPAEAGATRVTRPEIDGVRIDPYDIDEAVERAMSAVEAGTFTQVCTVNLDFLVNAHRNGEVRTILGHSEMNLADGSPVVWLTRLLGQPVPGRVAGADFVPRLMGAAASRGARVFFLGGEHGAAREAARRMAVSWPELKVAGVLEPPRCALDDMGDEEILGCIRESEADILLVAFGHPKQERWISAHRDRLPVSVAVGVGCTFDLIAGRRDRAPSWMQSAGLEWVHRVRHEPRRLALRYAVDAWCLLTVFVPSAAYRRLRSSTRA